MIDPKEIMYREGRRAALDLQERAPDMTGTELIAEEIDVPAWDAQKDYTGWKAGCPAADEGQVWILLIPHNAAHYTGRPSGIRSLWGLAHTTDPALIRRETEGAVKAALKYGCPMDYVLKDITTVSGKPDNLIVWAQTVSDVMDAYYGAD